MNISFRRGTVASAGFLLALAAAPADPSNKPKPCVQVPKYSTLESLDGSKPQAILAAEAMARTRIPHIKARRLRSSHASAANTSGHSR